MPDLQLHELRRQFFEKAGDLQKLVDELELLRHQAFPVGSTVRVGRETVSIAAHYAPEVYLGVTIRGGIGSRSWTWNRNLLTDVHALGSEK